MTNRLDVSNAEPSEPSSSITPEAVFHDAAQKFLDVQVSTNDVLDSRIAGAVSVGSTVLPLTFGLSRIGTDAISRSAELWFYAAIAAYVVLLACAIVDTFRRGLEYRPNIATLSEHVLNGGYSGDDLKHWVAREYRASVDANKRRLVRKQFLAGIASLALYTEGICLSVAALTSLN